MVVELKPGLTFDEYLEKVLSTSTDYLPSINCHLALSEVYDKVKWPEAE